MLIVFIWQFTMKIYPSVYIIILWTVLFSIRESYPTRLLPTHHRCNDKLNYFRQVGMCAIFIYASIVILVASPKLSLPYLLNATPCPALEREKTAVNTIVVQQFSLKSSSINRLIETTNEPLLYL